MIAIMNKKSSQGFMVYYTIIDELANYMKSYMCIHVNKCLILRHYTRNDGYRISWVAWRAHRRMVTRRCVLSARWPSPRGVPNLVALLCDGRMSLWVHRDKLTCVAHDKITELG
jgi:hypothetical protein